MKRYKLSAIIIAAVITVCSLFTSVSAESSEWIYLDDKGMCNESGDYEQYLDGGYYGIYLYDNNFYYVEKDRNWLSFKMNDEIDDVENKIISIFEKYYPVNNINSPSDYDAHFWSEGEWRYIRDTVSRENADNVLPLIRDELIENNLVTKIYDRGETGVATEIRCLTGGLPSYNAYYMLAKNEKEKFDAEKIQQYLDDNSLNCTVTDQKPEDCHVFYPPYMKYIVPDEPLSNVETFELAVRLYEEFGIVPCYSRVDMYTCGWEGEVYYEAPANQTPITLAGDLDLDNDTGLADIVILSKYNSNAEIYPISDETARANADVNNDGEINSLDINILIEQLLGSFKSAV